MTADKEFVDMSSLLSSIERQAEDFSGLNTDEKYKVTKAGGKVLKNKLKEAVIADNHVRHGKKSGSYHHLKDSISVSKKDENGMRTGSVRVGFDAKHAHIARWLNDGTKGHATGINAKGEVTKRGANHGIHGDHFVENTRMNAKSDVYGIINKTIKEVYDDRH